MIKVEAVYTDRGKNVEPKFDHFKATVGNKIYDPLPIKFIRISELKAVEEMLNTALDLGRDNPWTEKAG